MLSKDIGLKMVITGEGSIFHVHFTDEPTRDKRDVLKAHAEKQTEFSMGMIASGVTLTPHHPGFSCCAHTER